MDQRIHLEQPVGRALPGWTPPAFLDPVTLEGRWVRLEPLSEAHAGALFEASCGPGREPLWTYSSDEMPRSREAFTAYVARRLARPTTSLVLVPGDSGPAGMASWMRVDRANGVAEVGSILLTETLQRTTAATEAMWLMARHAFGLGYRRYEWKCDSLNEPSRHAAVRLGFGYEGTFRDHVVYKGRSRDTAWFAMTREDWAALAPAYDAWLDPANFEDPETGRGQRSSLRDLIRETAVPHVGTPNGPG